MIITIQYSGTAVSEFDIDTCQIDVSKHFRNQYMKRWGWDMFDLREAIRTAYKIDKCGKKKYEAYVRDKKSSKKIIFVYYQDIDTLFIISASEGR